MKGKRIRKRAAALAISMTVFLTALQGDGYQKKVFAASAEFVSKRETENPESAQEEGILLSEAGSEKDTSVKQEELEEMTFDSSSKQQEDSGTLLEQLSDDSSETAPENPDKIQTEESLETEETAETEESLETAETEEGPWDENEKLTEQSTSETEEKVSESWTSETELEKTKTESTEEVWDETEAESTAVTWEENGTQSAETDGEGVTEANTELQWTESESLETEETEFETAEEESVLLLASSYTPPGTIASAAGTGYTAVNIGDRRYSGSYCEIQKNVSSAVIPWDTSGGHVTKGSRVNSGGQTYTYFVPKDNSAAGKFGFRITNVAYNQLEKCAVDMIITVAAYNDFTYSAAGNKIEGVYPCIGYTPKGGIAYQPFLPAIRLKCDLVRSGTDIAVAGNYRFTMTDIDAGQIYGLTLFDGAMDARYCTASTVIHTGNRSLSDGKTYYMMYAPDIAAQETNANHAISFEVSGMSSFGLFIDSEKRSGKVGGYSGNAIRSAYNDVKDGSWNYGTEEAPGALLGWDSWAFGPPEVGPVTKYVSNDGINWGQENILPSVNSDFWYMLEFYAPEMSGYSYQKFFLNDQLPVGIEYVGDFSARQAETGADASGFFTVSDGENLCAVYNGAAGFNGYTYQLCFRVRMNHKKMTPAVSDETAVYTAENSAALYYQTNADASVLCTWSNKAVTTASINKPESQKPEKKINWNGSLLESKEYTDRNSGISFTVRQLVPAYESYWYMDTFAFSDVLEPCFELVSVAVGTDQVPGSTKFLASEGEGSKNGWKFSVNGQAFSVRLSGSGILPEHFDGNTVYRMDIEVRIRDNYDLTPYYQRTENGKQSAVIQNTASSSFSWGSNHLIQKTNQVKVIVSEVFGKAELKKINAVTEEEIADAGFTLYQWDGSAWEKVSELLYNRNAKIYYHENYIVRTEKNQGKFLIKEHITPAGYAGSWEQEFLLNGTPGECCTVSYLAKNDMATGTITVIKTSEDGKQLGGAVFEIYAKENIVSPEGNVLIAAGTKLETLSGKEDGTAVSGELYPGVYEVREIQPPEGYTLNTAPQSVEIVYIDKEAGASNEQVIFKNQQTTVYLWKVSALAPGENQKKSLSGVSFAVWNKNNATAETAEIYTTDENGKIELRGYVPGTYCYQERSVPTGYVPDNTVREFTIDQYGCCENEDKHIIEIENQYICAEFIKKDKATGENIPGAKLQLTNQNGTEIDTWISEETPHRINRIASGIYTLTELEAPDGYKKTEPLKIVIEAVDTLQSFSLLDVKYVKLTLTKSILTDEIVWAHGNPVFTFCVEGTDLDGEKYSCCETVEFTKEMVGKDEAVTLSAVLEIPAGVYTAYETNVIRYRLEKIDGIVNGAVKGVGVLFDLGKNKDGAAVFHNRKTEDTGISDTAFVRNTVIPQ